MRFLGPEGSENLPLEFMNLATDWYTLWSTRESHQEDVWVMERGSHEILERVSHVMQFDVGRRETDVPQICETSCLVALVRKCDAQAEVESVCIMNCVS